MSATRDPSEQTVRGTCRFCGMAVWIPAWMVNAVRHFNYAQIRPRGEQDIGSGELVSCDRCRSRVHPRSTPRRVDSQLTFTVGEILADLEEDPDEPRDA